MYAAPHRRNLAARRAVSRSPVPTARSASPVPEPARRPPPVPHGRLLTFKKPLGYIFLYQSSGLPLRSVAMAIQSSSCSIYFLRYESSINKISTIRSIKGNTLCILRWMHLASVHANLLCYMMFLLNIWLNKLQFVMDVT
uniref:Uncharacterized protein n=1 Tax=Oryza meridionalis TaxID=40149 RepID=A0A0E0CLQ9_9ORYZ